MPTPWLKRVKDKKELKVFNKAGSWGSTLGTAMKTFNDLGLGVRMRAETNEKAANVVVILANGPSSYTFDDSFYGTTKITTTAGFKSELPHGNTKPLVDPDRNAIVFAPIFLPGKFKASDRQKEVIIVHEFFHACGIEQDEHDDNGVMVAQMMPSGDGLLEALPDKDSKAMPPIRVGKKTRNNIKQVW